MRRNLALFSRAMRGRSGSRRGFALVVVLAIVLMVTVLIVGLLIMAENEVKSTSRYMDAADSRLAADSVVQIVQGQIRKATVLGVDASTGKGSMAWASQPGAVRVFDNSGNLKNIFKLYSSDRMVLASAAELFDGGDIPGNWETQTNNYVDLNAPVSRNNQWIYPIASPDALGGVVAGFDSARTNGTNAWNDRLAMPVRWIYIRKNGDMTTDPFSGDNKGTNEVVLRVAYWTDDESSKINVNTASATDTNSYADVPRANYRGERTNMAWMQPAQNEFNRYPGHPATVSLSTVFSGALSNLIAATPRYKWGGSENAKKATKDARVSLLDAKRDRLYGTPDEFLYDTNRTSQLGLSAATLDSRRFFITTTSRSSDLNLFGQPRVTIWPISAYMNDAERPNRRTPYDELIAHCSEIGGDPDKAYYFLRYYPLDQKKDWTEFKRNRDVVAFLQDMTSQAIPGFGGNFLEKYDSSSGGAAGERDQILTEIFDYIRCVNLNETYLGQPSDFISYTKKMTSSAGFGENASIYDEFPGPGFVLPIEIESLNTRGAGRVPVISEVGFWLIQTYTGSHEIPNPPQVQPALLIETFSPMQGFMPWAPYNFSYKVENETAPQVVGLDGTRHDLFPNGQTLTSLSGPSGAFGNSHATGGIDGWAWNVATHWQNPASRPTVTANPFFTRKDNAIPLSAAPLASVPVSGTSIGISQGQLKISLQYNASVSGTGGQNKKAGVSYQNYIIKIPEISTLPIPDPVDWVLPPQSAFADPAKDGWYKRLVTLPDNTSDFVFIASDVVRGIPHRNGDFRTMAYIKDVPATFFVSESNVLPPEFFSSGSNLVHGFRGGINHAFRGTKNGGYVTTSPTYGGETESDKWSSLRPKITSLISDLRASGWTGDFDNGVANLVDGPYLGKSDEGSLQKPSSNQEPYFWRGWWLGNGLFSPLRQVPSAVVFGSLPTGVKRVQTAFAGGGVNDSGLWRTLNFCPNPLAGTSHFGMTNPPDYLLLDLFTMPVVEPYAISEPFSTAGRLNMNYQIVPFTYIKRKTALHAALAAQKVIAIENNMATDYKSSAQNAVGASDRKIRFDVDPDLTLAQFDQRFDQNKDIFRSASEICSVFLIPKGSGANESTIANWWNGYKLTGNNSRERPYATLYPLLTTKSNVFTTHIRAQAVKRTPDGKIKVNGEYRGSVTFERFLDPNDPVFTTAGDPKTGVKINPDDKSLEPFFRFRTLVAKQFDL